MKMKILSGVFSLALLATAGFGVHKSLKSDAGLSDLALSNVEALAEGEIYIGVPCMNTNPYLCIYLGPGPDDYLEIVGEVYS